MRALTISIGVLLLLGEKIGAGIVVRAQPRIDIEQGAEARLPIGGVQATEPVTTVEGALDRLSPGNRNSAGSSGVPVSRPTRSSR